MTASFSTLQFHNIKKKIFIVFASQKCRISTDLLMQTHVEVFKRRLSSVIYGEAMTYT